MTLAERLLSSLSRPPEADDYGDAVDPWTAENALDLLRAAFPDLAERVRGRRVLDFGCGAGWQAAALAREGAAFVRGVDTHDVVLEKARALGASLGLDGGRLAFSAAVPEEEAGSFDV
ncbi:MAG TPA: methyltransferase domain-containing protein, partial [Longimicrobium sp.]|nr:methyltransferase domain-containing protein [Longimicrobium sp.]